MFLIRGYIGLSTSQCCCVFYNVSMYWILPMHVKLFGPTKCLVNKIFVSNWNRYKRNRHPKLEFVCIRTEDEWCDHGF
jgi:hypothetical protein